MSHRHTLEADLLRHQEAGDFAAQAETLLTLSQRVRMAKNDDGHSMGLAYGLCGQAWAAYEKAGDKAGMAKAMVLLSDLIFHEIWRAGMSQTVNSFGRHSVGGVQHWAIALCEESEDPEKRADAYRFMIPLLRQDDPYKAVLLRLAWCYKQLNDLAAEADMLVSLYLTALPGQSDHQAHIERALFLYQQLGDVIGQAHAHYHLGRATDLQQAPDRAYEAFRAAYRLFVRAGDDKHAIQTFVMLGQVILLKEGYEACHQHYREGIETLSQRASAKRYLDFLCVTLAAVARDHGDFATVRSAYQHAICISVSTGQPHKQVDFYWRWGVTEFFHAQRKAMGYALCRWAMALHQRYSPGSYVYEHPFQIMSRQMGLRKRRG